MQKTKRNGFFMTLALAFLIVTMTVVSGITVLISGTIVKQKQSISDFYRRSLNYKLDSLILLTNQKGMFSKFEITNDIGEVEYLDLVTHELTDGVVLSLRYTDFNTYEFSVSFPFRDVQQKKVNQSSASEMKTWTLTCTIGDEMFATEYTVTNEKVVMDIGNGEVQEYEYDFKGILFKGDVGYVDPE